MTPICSTPHPPRLAARLFGRLFPDRELYTTMGDLEEIFISMAAEKGLRKARRWYWGQLFKAIPHRLFGFLFLDIPMFVISLKIMGRSLRKHKSFSAIALLILTIGFACFFLIFLYVRYEFSYDSFHPNANRLFRLVLENPPGAERRPVPILDQTSLFSSVPEIEGIARTCRDFDPSVRIEGRKFESRGIFADESFLRLFHFPLLRSIDNPLGAPYRVVLTESTARRYFGEGDPLGRTLEFVIRGEKALMEVSGIVADPPRNTHLVFDHLISLSTTEALPQFRNFLSGITFNLARHYIKIHPGASPAACREKLESLVNALRPETSSEVRSLCALQPISDIHLRPDNKDDSLARRLAVYLFLGVLILAIAGINYVNLSTARSSIRGREIGVRKMIGAQRRHLVRQFIGEAVLLTGAAFILSLVLLIVLLPVLNRFLGVDIGLDIFLRSGIRLEAAGIVLVVGIAAGLYPALVMSSFQPVRMLRGKSSAEMSGGGARPARLRRLFVVLQFATASILVIVTLAVRQQVHFLKTQNTGFDRSDIIEAWAPEKVPLVKNRLLQSPRVLGVTGSSNVIFLSATKDLGDNLGEFIRVPDASGNVAEFRAHHILCDRDYLDFFKIRLVAGRGFSEIRDENTSAVVNETFARQLGPGDPIGRTFKLEDRSLAVVGVVRDFHVQSFHQGIRPVLLTLTRDNFMVLNIKFREGNPVENLKLVRAALDDFFPDEFMTVNFLDENVLGRYRTEETQSGLLSFFSSLAVVIAGLGFFGLATFAAERRTREISIRKVLGAGTGGLFLLLSGHFGRLSLVATLISWPPAFYLVHLWLRNFAYHIPIRLWLFLLSGAGMLGLMLLTCGTQIAKIARVNPVDTLKVE